MPTIHTEPSRQAGGLASGTPTTSSLQPAIIVIFGVSGDLSKRYLLPSVYHLFKQGLLHDKTEIIGVSRRDISLDDVLEGVELCVNEDDNVCDPVAMARLHSRLRIQRLDMDDVASFKQLLDVMNDIEAGQGVCMDRLYYLSVPPAGFSKIIGNMGQAGLNGSCPHGSAQTRLLIEKPFGQDYASAQSLIETTAAVFGEEQVYRIDHYLAKETAQNITAFRQENPIFQAIWNSRHITAIDILASEKIGIECRANLYEEQGALRDFIQNHLLQLLAIVAAEPPAGQSSDAVHAAKLALLQAVQPITADMVSSHAFRGQYDGYTDDAGNPDSHVETYARLETTINNERWQGVKVRIRTGKAMAERRSSITLTFTDQAKAADDRINDLVFRIQPNEGIELGLRAKKPGFENELQAVHMDFSYDKHFEPAQPTAYERVLMDAVRGDRRLFASSQEVLASWRIIDEVVHAWQRDGQGLTRYEKGTPIDKLLES